MSKRSDYLTKVAALERSATILKERVSARAGDWRPAGVAADGFAYPEGEWPGKPSGSGRQCRPEIGICTHAVPVLEGAGRLDGRFLVEDEAGAEVSDDEIKRVLDGELIPMPEPAEPARTREETDAEAEVITEPTR